MNASKAYFENLNYTLSNEDTRVEHGLLREGAAAVMAIAGSGARVLPLLARNPARLDVVDLSREQLLLCELRIAAARRLSRPEFLYFLGYRGGLDSGEPCGKDQGDDRYEIFRSLKLGEECREFWESTRERWAPRGFILLGKWENHFQKLGQIFRKGFRMSFLPIFEAHTLEEQQELYRKHWRPWLVRNFLRVVASEYVFNRFLYKGHFSGTKGRATESRPPWQFLDDEFRRIFTTTLVRKNYFMQVLFLGRIYFEEGLPLEAQPLTLERVKAVSTEVAFHQADLVSAVGRAPYEFYSLSDTISYLPEETARGILTLLHSESPAGSVAVIRSFLRAPLIEPVSGWSRDEEAERKAALLDGTSVYQFHVFGRS